MERARDCTASLVLNYRLLHDFELLANGGFSPLSSWMTEAEYRSVLASALLPSGEFFPLPIVLDVAPAVATKLSNSSRLCLTDAFNNILAFMDAVVVFPRSFEEEAEIFDPERDASHPAIEYLERTRGNVLVSGQLTAVQLHPNRKFLDLRLSPAQVREELQRRGLQTPVVAFQTRNPLHLAHLTLAITAASDLRSGSAGGATLLLHPVVGPTKEDDVPVAVRVASYRRVAEVLGRAKQTGEYPAVLPAAELQGISVLLYVLPLAMRLGGPREAGLHAVVRRNFGASHFVVGRDHAGCKRRDGRDFYAPTQARDWLTAMAAKHPLGIHIVGYPEFAFSPSAGRYVRTDRLVSAAGSQGGDPEIPATQNLSGTKVRQLLAENAAVPEWFSLPEVVEAIRPAYRLPKDKGLVVLFVGLSGSGKSTLANALIDRIGGERNNPLLLDGDVVRNVLGGGLGLSRDERLKQLERVAWVAEEVAGRGGNVVVSLIAPYRQARDEFRRKIVFSARANFLEIFVDTPISVCERRDTKGLYRKARNAEIRLTGVNDDWEAPDNPEISVNGAEAVEANVRKILEYLKSKGILDMEIPPVAETENFVVEQEGEFGTREYKQYLARPETGERISAWHDVDLYVTSEIVNIVVEIPRGTKAKMELNTSEALNPIMHDLNKKTSDVRFYKHPLPLPGNYGLLPRTLGADGDPLDVLEISGRSFRSGEVVRTRVLGVMGLLDQGEEDWKIIVHAVGPETKAEWSGETRKNIENWFREYKVYEGKQENEIVDLDMDANAAIAEAHERWKKTRHENRCGTRAVEEL